MAKKPKQQPTGAQYGYAFDKHCMLVAVPAKESESGRDEFYVRVRRACASPSREPVGRSGGGCDGYHVRH
jgi:hypothetical protein